MGRELAMALALCACGGVKYTASTTRGVACYDFANAFCERAIECTYLRETDRSPCEISLQNGCCGAAKDCDVSVFSPTGAADCVNRLPRETCGGIGTSAMASLPAYCRQMF